MKSMSAIHNSAVPMTMTRNRLEALLAQCLHSNRTTGSVDIDQDDLQELIQELDQASTPRPPERGHHR